MSDLSTRISNLSPEKRKLLDLLARKEDMQIPDQQDSKPPTGLKQESLLFPPDKEGLPEKDEVRNFYNSVSNQLNDSPFGEHSIFLNYGYVPNNNPQYSQVRLPDICMNKNPTSLVLEVIGDCVLHPEHEVLDIGCGRGGTVSVFRRFFNVRKVTGVDLSPNAILFCRKVHTYPETYFMEGDAENLPFEDQSFDIVTNIESSHTYGDITAFYNEVYRVLKLGGYFLYTDLISCEDIEKYQNILQGLGFAIERKQNITSNVLMSCDDIADTHSGAYSGKNDPGFLENFLAMPDSPVYNKMRNGKSEYLLYKFHKKA
ncbi:MAG: class I SAM-dependent methyltransferase [Desulfobacteraceae bacterium]|nr:class I SAM-dependent methyltransferase [Desulfobacteraceae bacterium]